MTASLLFSQAPYQTQPPDIERGMIGGSGQNRSAVSKTYDESSGDSCENFLNTLEQIAKDNTPNKHRGPVEGNHTHPLHTIQVINSIQPPTPNPVLRPGYPKRRNSW